MKIRYVAANNRKKAFELSTSSGIELVFPYARLRHVPTQKNRVREVYADPEAGREAFTYALEDGTEDTVHLDAVREYNEEPGYMREMLLYKLTVAAQDRIEVAGLSRREVIRRLDTSPSQLYRLLDQKNNSKTIDQMVKLLQILGCEVDVAVRAVQMPSGQRSRRTASGSTAA